jgi:hypothetical protein
MVAGCQAKSGSVFLITDGLITDGLIADGLIADGLIADFHHFSVIKTVNWPG